jgi:hypothetical protein
MIRPDLKSSMVVPIKAQDDVFGCLNLGALEVSPLKFSQEHIADMQNLIDLATEALYTPIKQHVGTKSEYFAQLL